MTVVMRPYQDEIIDEVRDQMRKHRRVLVQSPTGSGKTPIFCRIAEMVWSNHKKVTILGHRIEIVSQISRALERENVRHGVMAPGRRETSWPVQVAMVQTLANRLDRVPRPDLMIVDEAHHAIAGTYRKIAECWDGVHTLGVTATPQRLDGRGLSDCFDTLVCGPTIKSLAEQGYLARYRYIAPPVVADLSNLKSKMGDYVTAQVVDAMDRRSITGDAEEHYRKFLNGKPAIAFCASVEHAKHVAAEFCSKGWKAASVDGATHPDERADMIAAIGDGRLNMLASCSIIDEGTDIPVVQGCLILAPTQSLARYLQRVGRVLRPKGDGSPAIILDHVGDVIRHGMPDFKHKWTLEGKKRSQLRAPAIRNCPKCYLAFSPAPSCPGCGYEFSEVENRGIGQSIKIEAGQLTELSADWLKDGPLRDVLRSATTREQIDAIRKARGYQPNWTNVQMSLRMGFRGPEAQRQVGGRIFR